MLSYKSVGKTLVAIYSMFPLTTRNQGTFILVLSVVKARLDQPPSKSNLPLLIVKGLSRHKTLEKPIKYRG
jgi:hypothetical protein